MTYKEFEAWLAAGFGLDKDGDLPKTSLRPYNIVLHDCSCEKPEHYRVHAVLRQFDRFSLLIANFNTCDEEWWSGIHEKDVFEFSGSFAEVDKEAGGG